MSLFDPFGLTRWCGNVYAVALILARTVMSDRISSLCRKSVNTPNWIHLICASLRFWAVSKRCRPFLTQAHNTLIQLTLRCKQMGIWIQEGQLGDTVVIYCTMRTTEAGRYNVVFGLSMRRRRGRKGGLSVEAQLVSHAYLCVMTHQWRHLVSSTSASLHLPVWTWSLPFCRLSPLLPPEI